MYTAARVRVRGVRGVRVRLRSNVGKCAQMSANAQNVGKCAKMSANAQNVGTSLSARRACVWAWRTVALADVTIQFESNRLRETRLAKWQFNSSRIVYTKLEFQTPFKFDSSCYAKLELQKTIQFESNRLRETRNCN